MLCAMWTHHWEEIVAWGLIIVLAKMHNVLTNLNLSEVICLLNCSVWYNEVNSLKLT